MLALRKLLFAMHRRPAITWVAILIYAAAVTFPHAQVQWLVNEIAIRITHKRLYLVSAEVTLFLGVAITLVFVKRLMAQSDRRYLATFWILTIGLIWGAWGCLTANNVELVHYPQYVPEGMMLFALTLSPAESLAWITLFGGLDECFQYWDLMGTKRVPYDFNDVYMDVLGGAVGILLAMVFFECASRRGRGFRWKQLVLRPGIMVILGLVIAGIGLWSTGRMELYGEGNSHAWFALSRIRMPAFWFQVIPNGPNKYHTLSPIEGPLLILATIAIYAVLDRGLQISTTGGVAGD